MGVDMRVVSGVGRVDIRARCLVHFSHRSTIICSRLTRLCKREFCEAYSSPHSLLISSGSIHSSTFVSLDDRKGDEEGGRCRIGEEDI